MEGGNGSDVLQEGGSLQAGRVVLAVGGMGTTHLCVPLPGEDDRGAAGLGQLGRRLGAT